MRAQAFMNALDLARLAGFKALLRLLDAGPLEPNSRGSGGLSSKHCALSSKPGALPSKPAALFSKPVADSQRQNHLPPMMRSGQLGQAHPAKPKHPAQAYRAARTAI